MESAITEGTLIICPCCKKFFVLQNNEWRELNNGETAAIHQDSVKEQICIFCERREWVWW